MVFVNPYTFISFPKEVRRRPPLFHTPSREQAKERYTGTLSVTWNIRSPLAIPADGSWGCGAEGTSDSPLSGEVRIPGASVKGAVRSLHEALFAGCARVIDPLFTPVYREHMTTRLLDGWTLAVVVSSDGNVTEGPDPVVQVMPCSTPVMWTRGWAVRNAAPNSRLPRTGDFISPSTPIHDEHRQHLCGGVRDFLPAERGEGWLDTFRQAIRAGMSVILVTDTSARNANNPFYWATAKPNPGEGLKTIPAHALLRFRQRFRGSDRAQPGAGAFEDVTWPPPPAVGSPSVAQRRTVDGWFRQGDVLWVKMEKDEVTDIKLSLGWRAPAEGERTILESRIPKHVHPCRQIKNGLCLSCVVFGSIDATPKDGQDGTQDSYGGHVRFGEVTGTCTAGRRNIKLVPLGTPHPGAGVYYLTPITRQQMAGHLEKPDLVTRWDSISGESQGSRNLRGRKFYWHSNPDSQRQAKNLPVPRYKRQPLIHTRGDLCPDVHLVEEAELSQTITFDGLDRAALASLLATLTPSLLLDGHADGPHALHLGRGKPVGLGSVQAEWALTMTTTADRYRADATVLTELPGLNNALTVEVPERCGDLTAIKSESAVVLALHGLGDREADVSYPTLQSWGQFTSDAFHQSYEFFKERSGKVTGPKANPNLESWAPLPLVTETQGQG